MGDYESLKGTCGDPRVSDEAHRFCLRVLGRWPVIGLQFQDNDGNARCAHYKPCPVHDGTYTTEEQ